MALHNRPCICTVFLVNGLVSCFHWYDVEFLSFKMGGKDKRNDHNESLVSYT
jgi:hypothetical protein